MEEKYEPKTVDSKFMENMKKKHNTKEKDKVEIKKQTMEGILGDIVQVPDKLHMTGAPETASAKPKKDGENDGTTGKDMFKSTMGK